MTPQRLQAHGDIMQDFRRIHFVGIGGAGMSGIAEVLHNLG
jgi:UDP-N-acetylmuramate--alanine ligase